MKRSCPICGRVHRRRNAAEKCMAVAKQLCELHFAMNKALPLSVKKGVIEIDKIINSLNA